MKLDIGKATFAITGTQVNKAHLCSISAHWGYCDTSTMLMACVAAMISSASGSIHVVTKDARSSLQHKHQYDCDSLQSWSEFRQHRGGYRCGFRPAAVRGDAQSHS